MSNAFRDHEEEHGFPAPPRAVEMRQPSDPAMHFDWYRRALAGEAVSIHDGQPRCGYFRFRRHRNSEWIGAAIWIDQPTDDDGALTGDEVMRCVTGARAQAKALRPDEIDQLWTWVAKNPVPYDEYRAYYVSGAWPTDPAPAGANEAAGDGEGALIDQIHSAVALAAEIKEIADQAACDRAANIRDRLNDLAKRADEERVRLKKPHDDAGKAVQAVWKPRVDMAKLAADGLRPAIAKFLTAKERETAARVAEGAPSAPAPVRAGGAHGKRTGLRTVISGVEITDYAACLQALKDDAQVREAVEKAALRRIRAGIDVPGVKKIEERVAA